MTVVVFWDSLFSFLKDGEWHQINKFPTDKSSNQVQAALWFLQQHDFIYVKTKAFPSHTIYAMQATPEFYRFLQGQEDLPLVCGHMSLPLDDPGETENE